MHTVIIEVDGLRRKFTTNKDALLDKDWGAIVEDMIDTVEQVENF